MYSEFPRSEYEQRYAKAQELMEKGDIDVLIITEGKNYYYFTGHDVVGRSWRSYSRASIALLPRAGEPIILVHEFVASDAKRETWIDDVRPYTSLRSMPVAQIGEALKELRGRRIGAELGFEQRMDLPHNDVQELLRSVKAEFVDASALLWSLRMVKSKCEIDRVRQACRITGEAYADCFGGITAGMSEQEISQLLKKSAIERGADGIAFSFITSGDGNYDRISGKPTQRRVESGDMVWMDTAVYYGHYASDFSRAGVVGGASEKQEKMQRAVSEATLRTADAIRPGWTAKDVVETCRREMGREGLASSFKAGRLGHGIGMSSTEPPHITEYDETILRPGMTITIEPGVVEQYGVFHVEENILVTEDGTEILSESPRELKSL